MLKSKGLPSRKEQLLSYYYQELASLRELAGSDKKYSDTRKYYHTLSTALMNIITDIEEDDIDFITNPIRC